MYTISVRFTGDLWVVVDSMGVCWAQFETEAEAEADAAELRYDLMAD